MISNVLNILWRWCKPLGEMPVALPDDTLSFQTPDTSVACEFYVIGGHVKAKYFSGGVLTEIDIPNAHHGFVINKDSGSNILISCSHNAMRTATLYPTNIGTIQGRAERLQHIITGSVVNIMAFDGIKLPNLQYIPSGTWTNLMYLTARCTDATVASQWAQAISESTIAGTKEVHLKTGDPYNSVVENAATIYGWNVIYE